MNGGDNNNECSLKTDPSESPTTKPFDNLRPRQGFPDRDAFLRAVVRLGASDLHLKTGLPPVVRINGGLRNLNLEPLPDKVFEEKVFEFLTTEQKAQLMETGSVDLAYDLEGSDRFRMNIYRQESGISVAARRITRCIPSFQDLHLPPVIEKIAEYRQGLILVAGVTGSGKSTTIAAMIDYINATRHEHIITLEDPIEYLFTPKKSLINQREIGINVKDFPTALRALVRQNPDVVLIGEMRDNETFSAALQAAETGHLVFGTIHASTCAQTIGRLLDLFPEEERKGIRQSLVFNLRAIIAQKLLPSLKENISRVPINEVLMNIPIVQKLIAEERDADLNTVIQKNEDGMQSFTDSLKDMIENEFIDRNTAYAVAPNPEELKMRLKGIHQAHGQILG
jgi:twitching motility protein PilT